MKHIVELKCRDSLTFVSNYDQCPPGVYRVDIGDIVTFRFFDSSGNGVNLIDIQGGIFVTLKKIVGRRDLLPYAHSVEWKVEVPGPFQIDLISEGKSENSICDFFQPSSTIIVNPCLRIPSNKIQMLTVMPRRLGCISSWPSQLRNQVIERGYNAVHFTPCQTSGPSHSAYSIADVLDVDPVLFRKCEVPPTSDGRWRKLDEVLKKISSEIVTITDVVLNHASSEGSWATQHPESTYSLTDCPYLTAAWELDLLLQRFGEENPRFLVMKSESEIDECIHAIRYIVEKFNFNDFFKIDFKKSIDLYTSDKKVDRRTPIEQALSKVGTGRDHGIVLDLRICCSDIQSVWRDLNLIQSKMNELSRECFDSVIGACESTIRYERLTVGKIDAPLVPRYFSRMENGDFAVNNGWVMNWPAGVDFASPGNHIVYMKRHVVAWGDCIKLRYPEKIYNEEHEKFFIYQQMEKYCERIARSFDGIRLDNCHSTPVFVLRHLLGVMRSFNPNLIVMAELFTGEANNDLIYECTLGIDLLVREGMQIHSNRELSWKLWGVANSTIGGGDLSSSFMTQKPKCILYDSTHDNSTCQTKFGSFTEALPLAGVVCASQSAIGSSVGFDEVATCMPSVVTEPGYFRCDDLVQETPKRDIYKIWLEGYLDCWIVEWFSDVDNWTRGVALEKTESGWELRNSPALDYLVAGKSQFKFLVNKHQWVINEDVGVVKVTDKATYNNLYGTLGNFSDMKTLLMNLHFDMSDYQFFSEMLPNDIIEIKRMNPKTGESFIFLARLGKGDAVPISLDLESEIDHVVVACKLVPAKDTSCGLVDSMVLSRFDELIEYFDFTENIFPQDNALIVLKTKPMETLVISSANPPLFEVITPRDYGYVLFCCDSEESCYWVPGQTEKLVFAGLQGLASEIVPMLCNEATFLSSNISKNIRSGDWLFDYVTRRFEDRFPALFDWLNNSIRPQYERLPSGLKPKYFVEIFIKGLFMNLIDQWKSTIENQQIKSSQLLQNLLLASYQFTSTGSTVAAGLPHFSSGFMRCWGRDTFLSFNGLFLVSGRYDEGRDCILSFARVVRHGLIPNLFDEGNNPRYNSRDAVWFFLYSICCYIEATKDSSILETVVNLKYWDRAFSFSSKAKKSKYRLIEIVWGILESHWIGIDFIEENAGPQIDEYMKDKGFHVQIRVDKPTGLIVGGNEYNCGTWMDKMGSGERNRGYPATSRHGANVEINGIALHVLSFFADRNEFIKAWRDTLARSFDQSFWNPQLGFFNDTIMGDFVKGNKLRPNALIALAILPKDVVNPTHVNLYLDKVEESLLGPLGMRTLSAADPDYNGWYDNSDESRGYNYHNGPEWVWLFGYYLMCLKKFGRGAQVMKLLETHSEYIETSAWKSLPELTNMNGQFCKYSCPSQAWSVCCILEALKE